MPRRYAQQIYQHNLDAVSAALMAGDLCEMLNHIGIPNMMATKDCEVVVSSKEELEIMMQDFRAHLNDRGVTDYRRVCLEAEFVAGRRDMIAGRHETTARGADGALITPYLNHSVMMLINGRWRGIWVQAVMENTELQILSPDIVAAQAEARRILEQTGRQDGRDPKDP